MPPERQEICPLGGAKSARRHRLPPRRAAYCFVGIPAESAGTMFFMSLASPVGCRTTMSMLHLPNGDSDRGASYDPLPCPSVRNAYGALPAPASCFFGFMLTNQTV